MSSPVDAVNVRASKLRDITDDLAVQIEALRNESRPNTALIADLEEQRRATIRDVARLTSPVCEVEDHRAESSKYLEPGTSASPPLESLVAEPPLHAVLWASTAHPSSSQTRPSTPIPSFPVDADCGVQYYEALRLASLDVLIRDPSLTTWMGTTQVPLPAAPPRLFGYIEGPCRNVAAAFATLRAMPHHHAVLVLWDGPITDRLYPNTRGRLAWPVTDPHQRPLRCVKAVNVVIEAALASAAAALPFLPSGYGEALLSAPGLGGGEGREGSDREGREPADVQTAAALPPPTPTAAPTGDGVAATAHALASAPTLSPTSSTTHAPPTSTVSPFKPPPAGSPSSLADVAPTLLSSRRTRGATVKATGPPPPLQGDFVVLAVSSPFCAALSTQGVPAAVHGAVRLTNTLHAVVAAAASYFGGVVAHGSGDSVVVVWRVGANDEGGGGGAGSYGGGGGGVGEVRGAVSGQACVPSVAVGVHTALSTACEIVARAAFVREAAVPSDCRSLLHVTFGIDYGVAVDAVVGTASRLGGALLGPLVPRALSLVELAATAEVVGVVGPRVAVVYETDAEDGSGGLLVDGVTLSPLHAVEGFAARGLTCGEGAMAVRMSLRNTPPAAVPFSRIVDTYVKVDIAPASPPRCASRSAAVAGEAYERSVAAMLEASAATATADATVARSAAASVIAHGAQRWACSTGAASGRERFGYGVRRPVYRRIREHVGPHYDSVLVDSSIYTQGTRVVVPDTGMVVRCMVDWYDAHCAEADASVSANAQPGGVADVGSV